MKLRKAERRALRRLAEREAKWRADERWSRSFLRMGRRNA
jgi:hypothetical protein